MPDGLSVLVVRLSAIGDVVMTSAAVRALRRHLPSSRILWIVHPASAGILEGNPDIDEIIIWDKTYRSLFEIAKDLRRRQIDVAIDFQGLGRSGIVTLASGAKRRIGFSNGRELSTIAYNERVVCQETLKGLRCRHGKPCYMSLIEAVGIKCDAEDGLMRVAISDEEREKSVDILRDSGVSSDEPVAALCPATTRANKHWTEAGWSRLIELLKSEFGLGSVLLGSKTDRPLNERIISGSRVPATNMAGHTSLKQAAALIEHSAVAFGVDTGLMHVSVAVGTLTIGIFGPTDAWRNHIEDSKFNMVRIEKDCSPCHKSPTCEQFDCMSDIQPEDVIAKAEKLLSINWKE